MAIEATQVYTRHTDLYDEESARMWEANGKTPLLPNLHLSHTPNQSMAINRIESGAIVIAGSGMCTGGRIRHHLKHNIWREHTHLVIVGFQARGTLGRSLVDGAEHISLWGERMRVAAKVHTIGGFSAHADCDGLTHWYGGFAKRPRLYLTHGEPEASDALAERLRTELKAPAHVAQPGQRVDLLAH